MQRIEIRNFRQIKEATVQVNDVTVLIGEQASGKSTIAKLVYFFKSLRKDLIEISRQSPEDINGRKISNTIRDKFYLYFGSTARLDPDYLIKFYFSDDNFLVIEGQRPPTVNFLPQHIFNEIENEIRRSGVLINHYLKNEDINSADREEQILKRSLGEILDDNRTALYIPAGRNITVSYTDEFLELFRDMVKIKMEVDIGEDGVPRRQDAEEIDLILLRDFIVHSSFLKRRYKGLGVDGMLRLIDDQRTRGLLRNKIADLLKANYRNTEYKGEYFYLGNRLSRPLDKASSGQQESIRIVQDALLQIVDLNPVFRVVEEPEAHLFPSGQKNIMELLVAMVNTRPESIIENNNQLFITTHSPYLLTILNNLIFAGNLENGIGSDEILSGVGIPGLFRLKPNQVSAYMLQDGKCTPINDTAENDFSENATGQIGGNLLDNYWNELQNQFDALMDVDL
ncbi:MAG TPA: DUF2813 domain-containing protein [Bacteroidetes bacterium]|nr:DUF2813 domain-containing protein [Bacteroidota bacterium]